RPFRCAVSTRSPPWRHIGVKITLLSPICLHEGPGSRRDGVRCSLSPPVGKELGMPDPSASSTGDRPARLPDSVRSWLRQDPPRTPPWRVEGLPGRSNGPSPPRRPSWSRFWWVLLGLLAVNWIVSALLLGPAPRTAVSYTFFVQQVDTGNVKEITSTADRIEGVFKHQVPYPPSTSDAK